MFRNTPLFLRCRCIKNRRSDCLNLWTLRMWGKFWMCRDRGSFSEHYRRLQKSLVQLHRNTRKPGRLVYRYKYWPTPSRSTWLIQKHLSSSNKWVTLLVNLSSCLQLEELLRPHQEHTDFDKTQVWNLCWIIYSTQKGCPWCHRPKIYSRSRVCPPLFHFTRLLNILERPRRSCILGGIRCRQGLWKWIDE